MQNISVRIVSRIKSIVIFARKKEIIMVLSIKSPRKESQRRMNKKKLLQRTNGKMK
jgi:hypothetical protein